MKIRIEIINYKSLNLLFFGITLLSGLTISADAQQRDPFAKPVVRVIKQRVTVGVTPKPKPVGPSVVMAPPLQSRIDGYRVVRQRCAELGVACPKPTSVLTLDEMQVTGIFRTPRGYAAMVEASPLNPKLSYTIYPGEKFYDGQLVAIEDTRLIFRRITRLSDGKEVIASADKILRQDTINDLTASRPESQLQVNTQTSTSGAPTTTGAATSTPQMSAEAVPLSAQKDTTVNASETRTNQDGLPQNKSEPNENPAANTAAPAGSSETDAGAAPVKTKSKGKGKPKNNK